MLVTTVDEAKRIADAGRAKRAPAIVRHWACVLCLASADILSFALAALLFRVGRPEPGLAIGPYAAVLPHTIIVDVFPILAVAFVVFRALAGEYSRREPFWDGVRSTIAALFIVASPDLVMLLLKPARYSVTAAVASWVFLIIAIPVMRQGVRAVLARLGLWQRRTALIGNGAAAEKAFAAISQSLSLGFEIEWLVALDSEKEISPALSRLKTIASTKVGEAGLLVQAAGCDQAILAMNNSDQGGYSELVHRLSEANVETAIVPPLARLPLSNLTTSVLFGHNILLFQVRDNLRRWPQRVFKRAFDIVGALAALIVLSPLLAVLAFLVKKQDGGPVTYSQIRIGRDGVPFRCIKLRTMTRNADALLAIWQKENPGLYEEYQKSYKLREDPRITEFGKWLRRTSLDELPQLVNILFGDMSFVGPRPVVERELIDFYGPAAQLYLRVRPGLTGLWQVSGRNNTSYEERIALDEWYVLNWSVWYDLIILAQTFGAITSGDGAY
jgi:undecaprenyl-phosphate galactose phosphotransferase